MQPAPGKPAHALGGAVVAPNINDTRQLTPSIRTSRFRRGGWIMAKYTDVREYASPFDALEYTRLLPSGQGHAVRWNGRWTGETVLQAFGLTETEAIANLLETLDKHGLPYERDEARGALLALSCASKATPWELHPMGVIPKPRRARTLWRDRTTGKKYHIYKDTLRAHADPACTCPGCTMTDRTPPTTKKNKTK